MNIASWALLAVAVSSLVLSGCGGSGGSRPDGAEVVDGSGSGAGSASGVTTGAATAPGNWTGNPLDNPNSPLSTRTIYFDFDTSAIRDEFYPVLRAHAEYLLSNPANNLLIEGHGDERGSREYNIALGERRAKAVQRFLEAEGVDPLQISTISYGEERPATLGYDESAWSMNRRAVLDY